jgi:FixJ family two-component response regulator
MKEGALDFLEKPFESDALLECIQRALAKSREGREVETERAAIERRLATLSPRERQVLALVVKGC